MSKSINYPKQLKRGDKIAVTAPSSGVEEDLHFLLKKAKNNVENKGFKVIEGETIWTENKAASASKERRAQELMNFLLDETVRAIIPPWGGAGLLMEILPLLDWELLKNKPPTWLLGYSDTSTLTFVYTLITGNASCHGTNYIDLSADTWDDLTIRWPDVLGAEANESVSQRSSENYQSSWEKAFKNPGTGFYLDMPTEWKVLHDIEDVK